MGLKECITYTAEVVSHLSGFSEAKRRRILKKLEKIRRRADSPYLYVALVGDFSTGKSTFINALVGKNILKTAWQATTAVPTLIYCYGMEKICVVAETAGRERFVLSDSVQRGRFEERFQVRLPGETADLTALLSTDNGLTGKLRHIELWVPGFDGLKNICIIDTPGVNPGAEEASFHAARTREVLMSYADATIVLFQETQVFSGSFKTFLSENAAHFMRDAVFVITMMDLAEEDEREELLDHVRNQLTQSFGLVDPPVYGCCVKAVTSGAVDVQGKYWVDLFDMLREEIVRHMAERRQSIIHGQMTDLMESLIGELEAVLADNLSTIEQKQMRTGENVVSGKLEKEDLFTREKLAIQRRRYEEMHCKLAAYLQGIRNC